MVYTYKFKIEDMKDRESAIKIEKALDDVKGTVSRVNYSRREVMADTDARIEDLYEAIRKAGYSVTDIELVG